MSLIHRYKSNGMNIVLDVNSGCIHLVDEVTYQALPYLEEGLDEKEIVARLSGSFSEDEVLTAVSECRQLMEQGMLFTRDVYEKAIDAFTGEAPRFDDTTMLCLFCDKTSDINITSKENDG